MNLYDIMGPVAIALGIGGCVGYARAANQAGISIAATLVVGVLAGATTFVMLRRLVSRVDKPTERALSLLYLATFLGVLLATCLAALGILAMIQAFGR
jgi:NhaP-type Na+/H+ or K+/H+ antiporter